jgi:DNA-binding transcriptional MerR regulator/effector-binding domain-containing protein
LNVEETGTWLRIGEFARLAGVSVRTARYYASRQLLVPAFVDPTTSYRFYRLDQVPVLQRLRRLRALGFSIAELKIWVASPDGSIDRTRLLEDLKCRVERQMATDLQRLRTLRLLLEKEFQIQGPPAAAVPAERPIAPTAAYTIRHHGRCSQRAIYEMFESAELQVARHNARLNRPPFLLLHGGEYEANADVEVCIPIPRRSIEAIGGRLIGGAGRAVCASFSGPYSQGTTVLEGMRRWMESRGVCAIGPVREVYLRYGADQKGYCVPKGQLARTSANYLTEIRIPIADS